MIKKNRVKKAMKRFSKCSDFIACTIMFMALLFIDLNYSKLLPDIKDLLAILCSALSVYTFLSNSKKHTKRRRHRRYQR